MLVLVSRTFLSIVLHNSNKSALMMRQVGANYGCGDTGAQRAPQGPGVHAVGPLCAAEGGPGRHQPAPCAYCRAPVGPLCKEGGPQG